VFAEDDDVVLDLTDEAAREWAWVEEFRVANGVPPVLEDPVFLANLAQALLTHAASN
jgi:hypothetical protein